jgi:hypothetical protein
LVAQFGEWAGKSEAEPGNLLQPPDVYVCDATTVGGHVTWQTGIVVVAAVVLSACTSAPDQQTAPAPAAAPSTAGPEASEPVAITEPPVTRPSPEPTPNPRRTCYQTRQGNRCWTTQRPTRSHRQQVARFVAFAVRRSDAAFARLALPEIRLGLGDKLLYRRTPDELRYPSAWSLGTRKTYFRGGVGPFSPLDAVRRQRRDAADRGFDGIAAFRITRGKHAHCASPPAPAPPAVRGLQRIGLQPALRSIDSCLLWFSVDFFLDPSGNVKAITYDFWEP